MSYQVLDCETGEIWGQAEIKYFHSKESAERAIRDVQAFEIAHGVLKRYEIVAVVTTETGKE